MSGAAEADREPVEGAGADAGREPLGEAAPDGAAEASGHRERGPGRSPGGAEAGQPHPTDPAAPWGPRGEAGADAGREPLGEAAPDGAAEASGHRERGPGRSPGGAEAGLAPAGADAGREPLKGAPGTPALVLKLESFEGPLDLLLHLIRSQELDIRNIPIALVTEQYLACLELMQELDVDMAAEWLVMAATLLHIKSKMLLPVETAPEEAGEEVDPRDELVRRLLEYERFKEAGISLGARDQLGRDVFARGFDAPELADPEIVPSGPRPFEPISISDLLVAFATALANRPRQTVHEIVIERLSLADKMTQLLDRLSTRESLGFEELFPPDASRAEVVVSFLAVLELIRMKVIRAYQAGAFGPIRLFARAPESGGGPEDPLPTASPQGPLAPAGVSPDSSPEVPEE